MSKTIRFKLAKVTDKSHQYTNSVYMNPDDMSKMDLKADEQICIDEIVTYKCKPDANLREGTLGSHALIWQALHTDAKTAVGQTVSVEPWSASKHNEGYCAHAITIVVDTFARTKTELEVEVLEKEIKGAFRNFTFCKDQRYVMVVRIDGNNFWLSLRIVNIYVPKEGLDVEEKTASEKSPSGGGGAMSHLKQSRFASISGDTIITIMAASNPLLKIIQPSGSGLKTFGPDWDPEKMGIGGLDKQFATIFRRAFTSRLYPADVVRDLGVKHVKGMLLYGPPGTGKTLIARSIGKMLTEREPKVVNGPEILNKYVGQSEENVRALFQEAEEDQQQNGDKAGLHIIIFDEIDAICKQRGSTNTGTGVHDTVVNQLLSKIDGVNSLNNILVIGMTNRKDLIDDALLRSGRLEVHIEIGLPDEQGREQIFRIHTRQLRENGFMEEGISLSDYAKRTKNYTGAEIEAVVRSAVSFAMQQYIDADNLQQLDLKKMRNIQITKEFFEMALEEVKSEYGAKDEDLQMSYARGIYKFSQDVQYICELSERISNSLTRSSVITRQALLLEGDLGSGKTALATYLALKTGFPFIRVISAKDYVGLSDGAVCAKIVKVFNDAYKSPQSVVIIDDFERLIGYTIGPRFSNPVLQTLLTSIRKSPDDAERKIYIICTSVSEVITTLDIESMFDWALPMPSVSTREAVSIVMKDSGHHLICKPTMEKVCEAFPETGSSIGIEKLLGVIELAVEDDNTITYDSFKLALSSKIKVKSAAVAAASDMLKTIESMKF